MRNYNIIHTHRVSSAIMLAWEYEFVPLRNNLSIMHILHFLMYISHERNTTWMQKTAPRWTKLHMNTQNAHIHTPPTSASCYFTMFRELHSPTPSVTLCVTFQITLYYFTIAQKLQSFWCSLLQILSPFQDKMP